MTVPTTRRESVVDHLHGVAVPDPYRWLEHGDATEVQAWVAAQNEHTRQALDALPDRGRWHERLVALLGRSVVTHAVVRGPWLFTLERPAGADQFGLLRRALDDRDAEPTTLVDPVGGDADTTRAIDWFHPSPDGSLIAFGISDGGSEHSELRVVRTSDGSAVTDLIPHTRAASVAWEPDGSGFFYTRYPDGGEYHRSVFWHALGTAWQDDPLIWSAPDTPTAWPRVELSADGRWLLVTASVGWGRTDVELIDRTTAEHRTVIAGREAVTELTFGVGSASLVGVTTLDAPRGRLVDVPLVEHEGPSGTDGWTTLVPERDVVLGDVVVSSDELWVVETRDACDVIRRYGPDGTDLGTVAGLGDAVAVGEGGLTADPATGAAFAVVDAFDAPTTVWRLPRGPGPAQPWAPSAETLAVELSVERVRYPSADRTEIGMFLLRRPDVMPGPDVPVILNGYGGFAISETPVWSPQVVAWCQAGGVYAIAGLRGGAEQGEAWHHAGRRAHKQNVFDDFHAAADWLVDADRASRERLAIVGRSNGGLLVGAALTQRPDLCRAVWCGVPLLDMIRFPQFLIARLWTSEYGDPDVAEEFAWLWAYSPYHHVVDGTCYPATLFTTAAGDSRVDPLHARKMAALVQAATSCPEEHPVLLFQEGRAGHGVGKPVGKRADELADGLSFLAAQVGLDLGPAGTVAP